VVAETVDGSPGNRRGGGDGGETVQRRPEASTAVRLEDRRARRHGGVMELGDGGAQPVRRKGHYGHF
jgi:hypothetical protein